MLYKTKAIVLYTVNYSDKYSIVHVFTEEFGEISYLIRRNEKKKTSSIRSLFYPFAILELEVDHHNLREIQRIKEAKIHFPCFSVQNNPLKCAISLFLVEFISKILKNKQPDLPLFTYLFQSIQILELVGNNYSNFHLVFMIRLCHLLGFYPDRYYYNKGMYFDLLNGVFIQQKPDHFSFLNPKESLILFNLLRMTYKNMSYFTLTGNERSQIISRILTYYQLHLCDFFEIKSLEILREVFD